MGLIEKTYPAPYGGQTEQADELALDTQCRKMVNCTPDIVRGIERRNGTEYVQTLPLNYSSKIFHTYDRGEGIEQYIFIATGDVNDPLAIYTKQGVKKIVTYYGNITTISDYFSGNLKAMTIQDRTFIVNKDKIITQGTITAPTSDYKQVAYYWLKRASNDSNNPYNYAVYLNGVSYSASSSKSDTAASSLASNINTNATGFAAVAKGSIIKITSTSSFTFDYWDSWGSQASIGWKGNINKMSDLPKDIPWDGVIVKVTGNDQSSFTDYFIKSEGNVWVETRDPDDLRGSFSNMPIRVDRLSDGTFEVAEMTWDLPKVGSSVTNITPSFVDNNIQDIFFFKNRLGFVSSDSVILSEEGNYYNFYSKTALEVIDTDPIDITIASNSASKIYYAMPFQKSLYLLTEDSQYELIYNGTFSPLNVGIDLVTSYNTDVGVAPIVSQDSLYFISKTSDSKSQLREYIKNSDKLVNKGVNLTLNSPNFLNSITKMIILSASGDVVMYSPITPNTLYFYRGVGDGDKRIQSALFKWEFSININDIFLFDKDIYIAYSGTTEDYVLKIPILPNSNVKVDTIDNSSTTVSYGSYIELLKWYPKLIKVASPINKVLIKKVNFFGDGIFNATIIRENYRDTKIIRTYDSGSTKDMSATVANPSKYTRIQISNSDDNPFRITSYGLKGFFKQTAKELP